MAMENEKPIYLSMVIPAYNEEKRLPPSLRDIGTFFSRFPWPYETLVMVEKSTDNTMQRALEAAKPFPQIQVIDNQVKRGKGYAVRSGMLRARGENVFFMDADLSTPLSEVISFLAVLESKPDVDILIGSRQHPKSKIMKRQNPVREKMGQTFNRFVVTLALKGIKDTQCGFKAFRAKACHEIFKRQKLDGFSFDVEVLLLANAMGFKVEEMPVQWINSPDSKVHMVRDSLKMLKDLSKVRRLVQKSLELDPFQPSSTPR